MRNVLLALSLSLGCAVASDLTFDDIGSSSNETTKGIKLVSGNKLVICSDETYSSKLNQIRLNPQDLKNLEKPKYTQISYENAISGILNWIFVPQGNAKILKNPMSDPGNPVFATYSLAECVGICIFTPQATLFTHMDFKNIGNGKLERLISLVPQDQRSQSNVILVSSFHSMVFSAAYRFLKLSGFSRIAADIEPAVAIHAIDWTSTRYIKASTLGTSLSSIKGATIEDIFQNSKNPNPFVVPRSLIVNAKTRELYTLNSIPNRDLDNKMLILLEDHQKEKRQTIKKHKATS